MYAVVPTASRLAGIPTLRFCGRETLGERELTFPALSKATVRFLNALKFRPETVSVSPLDPATTLEGLREVRVTVLLETFAEVVIEGLEVTAWTVRARGQETAKIAKNARTLLGACMTTLPPFMRATQAASGWSLRRDSVCSARLVVKNACVKAEACCLPLLGRRSYLNIPLSCVNRRTMRNEPRRTVQSFERCVKDSDYALIARVNLSVESKEQERN